MAEFLPPMRINGSPTQNGPFHVYVGEKRHSVPLRRSMRAEDVALAINAAVGSEVAFAGRPPPAGWNALENVR